jgi:hypothetical protein
MTNLTNLIKDETFRNLANHVLERAKKISSEIKKNPVHAMKNIKQLIMEPAKKAKKSKSAKAVAPKGRAALKMAKKKVKKAVH